jgi:hypothetical protein
MKKVEREIIHRCYVSLANLPGKNNAMSGRGAAQYHEEMREAIALNNKAMMWMMDGEYEEATRFANDLTSLVLRILLKEGLSVTASMEALRNEPTQN